MNRLGEFIRAARGDLSLREFASKCNLSHTHIDSIEKGYDPRTGKPVRITTETLKHIADGAGIDFMVLAALAENIDISNNEIEKSSDSQSELDGLNDIDFAFMGDYKSLTERDKFIIREMAKKMKEQDN